MFRRAGLLATPIAPTSVLMHWAAVASTSEAITVRYLSVPGYSNRPFRATDGKWTSTPQDPQPCRLLPQRPKLSDPAHERPRLQPERDGGVRCSEAWLGWKMDFIIWPEPWTLQASRDIVEERIRLSAQEDPGRPQRTSRSHDGSPAHDHLLL